VIISVYKPLFHPAVILKVNERMGLMSSRLISTHSAPQRTLKKPHTTVCILASVLVKPPTKRDRSCDPGSCYDHLTRYQSRLTFNVHAFMFAKRFLDDGDTGRATDSCLCLLVV
jgi:hypothetical protein